MVTAGQGLAPCMNTRLDLFPVLDTPVAADDGTEFTISLTDPSEPSPVDAAAGFQYAFNSGSWRGWGQALKS